MMAIITNQSYNLASDDKSNSSSDENDDNNNDKMRQQSRDERKQNMHLQGYNIKSLILK